MKKGQWLDTARWWPVEQVKPCWFCQRGTAPGHRHLKLVRKAA